MMALLIALFIVQKDLPNNYDESIDFFWLPWNELPNDVIVLPTNKTIEELLNFQL